MRTGAGKIPRSPDPSMAAFVEPGPKQTRPAPTTRSTTRRDELAQLIRPDRIAGAGCCTSFDNAGPSGTKYRSSTKVHLGLMFLSEPEGTPTTHTSQTQTLHALRGGFSFERR